MQEWRIVLAFCFSTCLYSSVMKSILLEGFSMTVIMEILDHCRTNLWCSSPGQKWTWTTSLTSWSRQVDVVVVFFFRPCKAPSCKGKKSPCRSPRSSYEKRTSFKNAACEILQNKLNSIQSVRLVVIENSNREHTCPIISATFEGGWRFL